MFPRRISFSLVNMTNGEHRHWRELSPGDTAGLHCLTSPIIAADGGAHAFTYSRSLSDLYVAEEIR